LSVLWILVLVNAFNFLDNMDGLSSGIALIAAVVFATVMLSLTGQPRWLVAGVMLVLVGSLTAFGARLGLSQFFVAAVVVAAILIRRTGLSLELSVVR